MGWIVWAVWVVWDMAAKACGRSRTQMVQTMQTKTITRMVGGNMGRCYRCSTCGTCWPFQPAYSKCIKCDSKCWSKLTESDDDVLSQAEARRIKAYIDFDAYCELQDDKAAQEEIDRLASDLPLYPDAFV